MNQVGAVIDHTCKFEFPAQLRPYFPVRRRQRDEIAQFPFTSRIAKRERREQQATHNTHRIE